MLYHLRPLALIAAFFCWPGLLAAGDTGTFSGSAHNVTVGIRGSVTLQISRNPDQTYRLSGEFDNVSLAGEVTATGHPPRYDDGQVACARRHECILFTGVIMLDSRAGFEDGTTSYFNLHLDLDNTGDSATGVYHIGPLPGFEFEQYGILVLSAPIS